MSFGMYAGMQIFVSPNAVEPKASEDWSRVRSPSRAARRRKQGHRQNIVLYHKPAAYQIGNALHIHPVLYREMQRRLGEKQ